MVWNPLDLLRKKQPEPPKPGSPPAAASAREAARPAAPQPKPETPKEAKDVEDLEKTGLLPRFFRHWRNPAFLKKLRGIVGRMQAEGVNIKDRKAVETWIKQHQKEIEAGDFDKEVAVAKPQTYVKTGPDVGRNDPCTCGSGKKYKKCCGAKVSA